MDTTLLRGLALLETQDGAKSIKGPNGEDSFNLFNVKQFDQSQPGFVAQDKAEGSRDRYRAYASREESIQDVLDLIQRRYPKAAEALKSGDKQAFAAGLKEGGYATDPNYVTKLVGAIDRARGLTPEAKRAVQEAELKGDGAVTQLVELRRNGWGADIDEALRLGWKPEDIVKRIAGAEVEEARAARERQDAKGTLGRFGEGVSNAVSDAGLAARQIVASGDQEAALRTEAARRRDDLERRANAATTAGTVGEMAPGVALNVGAALATGGMSLPAQLAAQAGVSAATGALKTTTEDGERTKNVLADALLGAGAAAVPLGGGRVMSKALARDPAKVAEREALAARLSAEGLPVNAATLTQGGKNVAERLAGSADVTAFREGTDAAIASKVAEGLGIKGYTGAIDTELLNAARPSIKQTLDEATDFSLAVPQGLKDDIAKLVGSNNNPLTAGIAEMPVVKRAAENVMKADGPVSARQLQELVSELKAVAGSQSTSATERQVAGKMVGSLQDAMTGAMKPEQATAFREGDRQYANLKAVENMVRTSGDSGIVTPRQMLNAVKTGRFKNSFLRDEAPYQELSKTAAEALGPSNGRGLADLLGRTVAGGDSVFQAATVLEPASGAMGYAGKKLVEKLLAKAVTSENPTVVRLLTGVGSKPKKASKRYLARALAGTSAGLAAS